MICEPSQNWIIEDLRAGSSTVPPATVKRSQNFIKVSVKGKENSLSNKAVIDQPTFGLHGHPLGCSWKGSLGWISVPTPCIHLKQWVACWCSEGSDLADCYLDEIRWFQTRQQQHWPQPSKKREQKAWYSAVEQKLRNAAYLAWTSEVKSARWMEFFWND